MEDRWSSMCSFFCGRKQFSGGDLVHSSTYFGEYPGCVRTDPPARPRPRPPTLLSSVTSSFRFGHSSHHVDEYVELTAFSNSFCVCSFVYFFICFIRGRTRWAKCSSKMLATTLCWKGLSVVCPSRVQCGWYTGEPRSLWRWCNGRWRCYTKALV